MIAILYNIRSLQNVGSIFRTADAAGITKLFLCGITPSPVNKYGFPNHHLAKTALGAQNHVAWEKIGEVTDISPAKTLELIENLQNKKFTVCSVEQSEYARLYSDYKVNKNKLNKTAIIVGPEIGGLPKEILESSDEILEIPMHGHKESLNVSVAFGIIAFSLMSNAK